jgi:uncharacterized protein YvpB
LCLYIDVKNVYLAVLRVGVIGILVMLFSVLVWQGIQVRALGAGQPVINRNTPNSSPTKSIIGDTSTPIPAYPSITPTPFQPHTFTPLPTNTPTASLTPTPTFTPTASQTYPPTDTPPATDTPQPPVAASIQNIYGGRPAYSLDCESRSAVDWAGYFGVSIDEIAFFNSLPSSDNPDKGFVGNVHGAWGQIPPLDYGIYARPVAQRLRAYGLEADAVYGLTWQGLQAEIASGEPVIVWVVGRVARGTPVPYTSSDGQQTTVVRFQHTVIVTGYDQQTVTVLDGDWVYQRSVRDFLDSWGALGNMAVIWDD